MATRSKRTRLLASTVLIGAVVGSGSAALAQDAGTTVKEVVVTGSRIPRPNSTAVSPVQTVGQQEFKLEGTVDAETLLNNLPSVSPSATQFSNNGSTGIATVDLRGFGTTRTLVLIDGRRMPPGDPSQPVADLNLIPSALVDNVDVLTGGASSIYGSDAIAGVVNFKMKHNFQGLQIDAQYDFAQHDNTDTYNQGVAAAAGFHAPTGNTIQGRTEHITITFGSNTPDGKGNVEGYLGYLGQAPVRQSAYDFAYCALGNTGRKINGTYYVTGHYCGGSSNTNYGRWIGHFWGSVDPATGVFNPGATQGGSISLSTNPGPVGNFVSYGSSVPGGGGRTWDYAPFQYFQRQDTRYQGGYFAHYDLTDHITAYSDFLFEDDHSTAQLAPSGLFFNNGAINQISCNNPLASASQLAALCGPTPYSYFGQTVGGVGTSNLSQPFAIGYRMAGENRQYLLNHDSFKMDWGFKGNIDDAWSYDVYAQFGKSTAQQTTVGDVSKTRIANALNVLPNGQCAVGGNCVPLNIFQPLGEGLTPQQFNYIEEDASVGGYTTEQVVSGNIVGKLGKYGIKSPWANEGVGIALGAEYRRDFIHLAPDAATVSGDLSGASVSGTPNVSGSTNVKEIYGELSIPIVQDHFLMKDVSTDVSYRRSDYNLAGTSGTYKFGADWAVNRDIRFRGAFARTERAPNVLELFTPAQVGNASFSDPCAGAIGTGGTVPSGYTAAQCYQTAKNFAALGINEAQFAKNYYGNIAPCPAGQCDGKFGGNTHLSPEIADTTTFGFVATPSFLRGFYASVDYWDIHVLNYITTVPESTVLNSCLQDANSPFCSQISRDPVSGGFIGTSGYVSAQDQNIGGLHKRGYDIQANYRFRLSELGLPDWGSIEQDVAGTYLINDVTSLPGQAVYNCAGLFGVTCGQSDPRWRHKYRLTWATPWKVDLSLQWRYIAQVKADVNSIGNPVLSGYNTGVGATTLIDGKIPAYSYIDLAASWRILDNITLRAGVNNVFDKEPPALDSISYPLAPGSGNTYAGLYDPLGRTIFINLTGKF